MKQCCRHVICDKKSDREIRTYGGKFEVKLWENKPTESNLKLFQPENTCYMSTLCKIADQNRTNSFGVKISEKIESRKKRRTASDMARALF